MRAFIVLAAALAGIFALSACAGSPLASASHPTATATLVPTLLPTPTPTLAPQSWLRNSTLLTIYGRGFNIAPILGRLGMDASFTDLARQVQPFVQGIRANNGGRQVRVAVHLIYAIATPCASNRNCLGYLDDTGVDIVRQYILPAQRRGWLVILDDQLGLSNPAAEVRRMEAKGYLRYDNVEVALDPEFRAVPGQPTPGIPVGSVTAAEINAAAGMLNHYGFAHHLRHHKVLLVHQFQWGMIQNRQTLRWWPRGYVEPVIVADGFGTPGVKAKVYSTLLGPQSRRVRGRGIKLFYPNSYEQAGHLDYPIMTWRQVFGRASAYDGTQRYRVWPPPVVVVIA